jgi:ABC-2 type transport system ATP-binding protein
MIEAIDLSKRYPSGKLALDALNLRVEPGEIYGLLGAKGAGKTTVMNLFLGFTEPTAGKALIDGIDVAREPREAKRRAAFLADDTALYGRLTARQNLDFFARLGGRSDRTREDYDKALREVGLPEACFGERLTGFTLGMCRKVGIALALVKGAPALLLDEPSAGLDPREAEEIVELLERLRDQGHALLIATHDLLWARQLADQVGILKEGRQVLTRSREELRYENLEKLYGSYMRGSLR